MRINPWNWKTTLFVSMLMMSLFPIHSKAVTVEVEEDEEDVAATPAAVPVASKAKMESVATKPQAAVPPPSSSAAQEPPPQAGTLKARVRINDKIGFYYFVRAGFVSRNEAQPHFIGKVAGSFDTQIAFSTPKKTYIELASSQTEVKAGDMMVVFRNVQTLDEPHSGLSGYWVQNLAIVKVLEVDKKRCLVEVVESFSPFVEGDKARFYDDEIQRWKQAQIKKNLPDHPIKCFVTGGGFNQFKYNQTDWIILSAGSGKGVV